MDPHWATKPSTRFIRRIFPLSIVSGSFTSPARILVSEEMPNGTSLPGTRYPTIEYTLDDDNSAKVSKQVASIFSMDDDEESELENKPIESDERPLTTENTISNDPDGSIAWKAAIVNAEKSTIQNFSVMTQAQLRKALTTTSRDLELASELDFLAERARNASDAALLEDLGDGLPYLSGACRGFAYDLTEDGCGSSSHQGGPETLKMHEKSKPPREEKLYALGWKDNCCFYGNSETYMTLPGISHQKKANSIMNHFRGNESAAGQLASVSCIGVGGSAATNAIALSAQDLEPDSLVFPEELDQFVHQQDTSGTSSSHEEDCYLPRSVPQTVLDFPKMLRNISVANGSNSDVEEVHKQLWDGLEARRMENLQRFLEHTTEYILPPLSYSSSPSHNRAKWSYGRFDFYANSADRNRLLLEFLPVLRNIGHMERCAEFIEEQQKANAKEEDCPSSVCRRSTRRATRAAPAPRRHHYFDKLSVTLRRDEADLDTSAVGALFANQWHSDFVHPSSSS